MTWRPPRHETSMKGSAVVNAIIYLVGLIVIVMAILSLAGLH